MNEKEIESTKTHKSYASSVLLPLPPFFFESQPHMDQPKPHILNSTLLFLAATKPEPPPSLSAAIPSSVPRSKLIPNTRFLVDAFRHADQSFSHSYFLSHFHSDHYTGLSPSWSRGLVFCSDITASLLRRILGVPDRFVVPLPLRRPVEIDGAEVLLVDANHCPGAVQFLFKVPVGGGKFEKYVHTGDFRFRDSMILEPALVDCVGCDAVFLDTTYCNPKFVFPKQEESVDYVVSVVESALAECGGAGSDSGSVLFLVATYVIGKEKILLELSRRLKMKVHVDAKKMEVLRVLGYGESGVFTEDVSETNVHVVGWNVLGETWPYFRPNFIRMKEIMIERGYSRVVGFVPTGWTYEVKRRKFAVRAKDSFQIHLVPYSEHSNYEELREYVKFLKPKRVVPTVGLDVEKSDSKHADKIMKYFTGLVDETANKQEFLKGFHRSACEVGFAIEKDVSYALKGEQNIEKEFKQSDMSGEKSIPPDIDVNLSSFTGDPCTQGPSLLNDEEKEKIVQELSCCLPTWVTRSQLLELISMSGGNAIEAVSNFYEHETEFHQQVFSNQTAASTSKCCLSNDTNSLSKTCLDSNNTDTNASVSPSQNSKLTNLRHKVSSNISPAKRNKSSGSKPKKKVKIKEKSQPNDSKQSTITKFFTRALPEMPSVTQPDEVEWSDQSPKDENLLPTDVEKVYKDEIEQFLQIVNGKESLKEFAFTLIEKTKGDVNKALDIYYCNSGNLCENEISLQAECKTDSSLERNYVSPALRAIPDITVQKVLRDSATHVTLPLEKYNPKEHACWRDGQRAPYLHLARTFSLLEDEKGKLKATSMLCNMFRSLLALSPEDVLAAVYLCTNKIAADHENMELNIGGSIVAAAIEEACGTNRSKIKEMYNKFGDLGWMIVS